MFVQHTNENVNPNQNSDRLMHHQTPTPPHHLPPLPILLAVQPLDFEMGVEVEDDALRGLWCRDDPVTVLVRRVLQRIPRGSDVTGLACIQDTAALCHYNREGGAGEGDGYSVNQQD